MENNKKTVMVLIVVVALLLGVVIYFVYDKFIEGNNNSISEEFNDYEQDENINDDNDKDNEIINNNDSNNNSENINNSQNTDILGAAKASSKQEPLSIGEWGIASKYVSGGYVDVPAKVINVTRGESAAQELKEYLDSGSSIYAYSEPKNGMEWAVVEYSIDLTQMEKDSTVKLDTKVAGTGKNTSIVYKDTIYIVTTINMTPNKFTKGNIENCKFAVQLPIGCTDYLIVLGSSSETQAFFKGK